MATIKSFTDISQSKKLAEILPLKSADMDYIPITNLDGEYSVEANEWDNEHVIEEGWIPAWSLSALLNILPESCDGGQHCLSLILSDPRETEWLCTYEDDKGDCMYECYAGNQVDACYKMIIELRNLNKLWL